MSGVSELEAYTGVVLDRYLSIEHCQFPPVPTISRPENKRVMSHTESGKTMLEVW